MTTLETITHTHREDLDRLNDRISKRLESANPLMTRIVSSLLRTKGKQLRPLLLIICAKMFGSADERVLAAAAAVELIHNASLIHDDVVDNSMTRRSRPTVNAVWDNHIAVLVGDFFTSSAMNEAISTGDIRIVEALSSLGRNLSLGEIDQICNAREHSLDEDGYYRVIDYKTASLFVASARMGCLAAGVDDERMDALAEYALAFGRCFQIRDDIFDYFAAKEVGKPTGNDLREGKITLPLLHALSKEDADGRQAALELIERDELSDEQIAVLQDFARRNGGIEYSCQAMGKLRDQACKAIEIFGDHPLKQSLVELFDFTIQRNY